MGASEARARRGELMQQHTNKWQNSTKDMWKRSATMWFDFEDKCHQTTVEVFHKSADSWTSSKSKAQQSTTKAWHRSTVSWSNSRTKAQESTTKAWNQSTDTWNNSLQRYRESTAGILSRSAENLNRSAENLNRAGKKAIAPSPLSDWISAPEEQQSNEAQNVQTQLPSEPTSPSQAPPSYDSLQHSRARSTSTPVSPDSQHSMHSRKPVPSPTSSEVCESPKAFPIPRTSSLPASLPETSTDSTDSTTTSIDLSSKKDKAADKQVRELIELTNEVTSQLKEAKQLRESNDSYLGEIEHQWVNSTITDADNANQDMNRLLEPLRIDMTKRKGKLSSSNRKQWRTRDCDRAREKYAAIVLHQGRLQNIINHLSEVIPPQVPSKDDVPELEKTSVQSAAELPTVESPTEIETFESLPVITELPSDPIYIPLELEDAFSELPGESSVRHSALQPPIPRIIVTQSADDLLDLEMRSNSVDDYNSGMNEMHDNQAWKQTRNDIRDQQSASFTKIISKMETKRFYRK